MLIEVVLRECTSECEYKEKEKEERSSLYLVQEEEARSQWLSCEKKLRKEKEDRGEDLISCIFGAKTVKTEHARTRKIKVSPAGEWCPMFVDAMHSLAMPCLNLNPVGRPFASIQHPTNQGQTRLVWITLINPSGWEDFPDVPNQFNRTALGLFTIPPRIIQAHAYLV